MSQRMKLDHRRAVRSRQIRDRDVDTPTLTPPFFEPPKEIKLIPKNLRQKAYIEALTDPSKTFVIGTGPAGTGKTYLAMLHCIQQLQEGVINKIILIRPVITADGSELGALPGGIADKVLPYLGEVASLLKEHYGVKTVSRMLEDEKIEVLPLAIARGRSFRNCGVIVEESQNIQDHVMKLLLTRVGFGSRLYINGDTSQSDTEFNGLEDLLAALEEAGGSDHFAVCRFTERDVERHPAVAEVLRIYG